MSKPLRTSEPRGSQRPLVRAACRMLVLVALSTLAACSMLGVDPLPGREPAADREASPSEPEPSARAPSRPRSDASRATQELLQQSRAARTAGNYPQATAITERALRIDPNNAALWLELGEIALAMGDTRQTTTLARKALSLAADDRAIAAQAERLLRAAGTR